jgi:predicted RNase H-like HicB family nuclease
MKQKKTKILEYNVVFTQEEEGGYSCYVPDLPGCISQGETFEKAVSNIREAIELYLEDADKDTYFVTPEERRKQFIAPIDVLVN